MASASSASSSSSSSPPTPPPPFSLPITSDSGSSTRHHRRRTRSFCSSSISSPSSFSSFLSFSSGASYLNSLLAPSSRSPSPSPLSSIPFSWEDQPGVPKTKAGADRKSAAENIVSVEKNNQTTTNIEATIQPSVQHAGHRKTPSTNSSRSISSKFDAYSPPAHSHCPLRPPPLRSCSHHFSLAASFRWRRNLALPGPGYVRDPFTVALIECSKHHTDDGLDQDDHDGDSDSASWKLLFTSAPATLSPSSDTQQRRRRQQQPSRKVPIGGSTIATGGKLYASSCKTSCAVIESAAILVPRTIRTRGTKAYDLIRGRPL